MAFLSSNSSGAVVAGNVVVHVGLDRWLPYNQAVIAGDTGGEIGVCLTPGLPGNPILVTTVGDIPINILNLGPGNPSPVVAGINVSRGAAGITQIGNCDISGKVCIFPSFLNTLSNNSNNGGGGGGGGGSVSTVYVTGLSTLASSGRATVFADGYAATDDGGQGSFIWNSADTRTANGGTIIAVTGIATGRWNRVYLGAVSVHWFGAKGDGVTDDSSAIQNTINAVEALGGGVVNLGPLTYLHTVTITVPPNIILQGVNRGYSGGLRTPISQFTKNTYGDGFSTAVSQTSQLPTSIVFQDVTVTNTFDQQVLPWAPATVYSVGHIVRPATSALSNGANKNCYSTRFLKCTSGGTSGTYQPIGTLFGVSTTSSYPAAVKLTGTPANDSPIDIQITGDTTFTWSPDRGVTTHALSIASTVVLGASGYTANFALTDYTGVNHPLYTAPTFKWSLLVGDVIVDSGVTWEVVDAGAGINDVGGSGWSIERCVIGTGYNTGLILDFSENFHASDTVFGGQAGSRCGVWICNGGENMFGRSSTQNASDNSNVLSFVDCVAFGAAAALVDDGGTQHSFLNVDFEGTLGVVVAGVLGGTWTACYTEAGSGNAGYSVNELKLLSAQDVISYGLSFSSEFSGAQAVNCKGFRNNGQVACVGLQIVGGFYGDGSGTCVIAGAGNVQGLYISPAFGNSVVGIPVFDGPGQGGGNAGDFRNCVGAAGVPGYGGMGFGGTASPQNSIDTTGISFRPQPTSLTNGAHHNLQIAFNGIYAPAAVQYLQGPTAAFNITGMGVQYFDATYGSPPGAVCHLINVSTGTMTINHQNAGSAAANRFICPGGADLTLAAGTSFVDCWYDAAQSRWIVLSFSSASSVTQGNITFPNTLAPPTISQAAQAGSGGTAGFPILVEAQAGQNNGAGSGGTGGAIGLVAAAGGTSTGAVANSNGGNVAITTGAAGTGGSGAAGQNGYFQVLPGGGAGMWSLGNVPGTSTLGFWGLAVSPTTTNYVVVTDGNSILLNAPNGVGTGLVSLEVGGTTLLELGSAGVTGTRATQALATTTPVTLSAAQYQCPVIALTGTINATNVVVVFPNLNGAWDLDVSGLSLTGAGPGLSIKSGSQTVQVLHSTPGVTTIRILTSGSNVVCSSYFN